MTKEKKKSCCAGKRACCKVEALISVDERGQMVLPKEIRDWADIRPGDKLVAVHCCDEDGKTRCISLIKSDVFGELVKGVLGPAMKEIIEK